MPERPKSFLTPAAGELPRTSTRPGTNAGWRGCTVHSPINFHPISSQFFPFFIIPAKAGIQEIHRGSR